jgi:hypothetical protein
MSKIISKSIDDFDDLNESGTLENQVFIQNDCIDDNSVCIIEPSLLKSEYFTISDIEKKYSFNKNNLLIEIIIFTIVSFFIGFQNINIISYIFTIDGIISCISYYFKQYTKYNNKLDSNRLNIFDRYVFYIGVILFDIVFSILTNFTYTYLIRIFSLILILPTTMTQIYNNYTYKKFRHNIREQIHKIIQRIILKQLSKIINLVAKNLLDFENSLNYEDLIPFYNQFQLSDLGKFFGTIISAAIFNHLDKGGLKLPISIYKNLYMKDKKYKISDDKEYLITILRDKKLSKFTDIYTLNRIIRLLIEDDSDNSILEEQINKFIKQFNISFNNILLTWTILIMLNYNGFDKIFNFTSIQFSILFNLIFISNSKKPLRYIGNILLFLSLSFYYKEDLLLLILFEIFVPIIESKIITDILKDITIYFFHIIKYCIDKVYFESLFLSILLVLSKIFHFEKLILNIFSLVNCYIMSRLYLSNNPTHIFNISNNFELEHFDTYILDFFNRQIKILFGQLDYQFIRSFSNQIFTITILLFITDFTFLHGLFVPIIFQIVLY